MKTKLIYVVVSLLFCVSAIYADDDPETPWPVEERCVPDAVHPPDDWTFEGTIIAEGWAGIHGIRAEWATPQVLAFDSGWLPPHLGGYGTLSPQGRWYVIPRATYVNENIYGGYVEVTQLLIYDLMDRKTVFQIEWQDKYNVYFSSSSSSYYVFRTPVWFDDDTIIYQRGETFYFVHVPSLEIEEWVSPSEWEYVSPVWVAIAHPSPDWSRIVARVQDIQLFNTETNEIMAEVYSPPGNFDLPSVAWHPSSREFLISGFVSTKLHDADGKLLDTISLPSREDVSDNFYLRSNAYSPDGTLFYGFVKAVDGLSEQWHLAVADSLNATIMDTCIDSNISAHFSPDGRQIALLSYNAGPQELQILDLETWQLYRTGIYHRGGIIGWRED